MYQGIGDAIDGFFWLIRWLLFWLAVALLGCIHQMGYCLLSVAAGIAAALSLLLSFGIWYATKD